MSSSLSRISVFFIWTAIFLLFAANLTACSYAYQYSLFPLGSSGGKLIFLEIELERYVNTPAGAIGLLRPDERSLPNNPSEIETRWKGNLRLKKQLGTQEFLLLEDLAYIDISDITYHTELAPYFEKAMRKAYALPFFEEAILEKIAYCKYDRSCDLFLLEVDTISIHLNCGLAKAGQLQNSVNISFPPIILQKFENITQLNFSEIEKVEKESRIEFFKVWKPYEARQYSIGNQTLVVYTIGWGLAKGYPAKKEENWKNNIAPVEKFIEGNDVMMHGQRFDFFQFL